MAVGVIHNVRTAMLKGDTDVVIAGEDAYTAGNVYLCDTRDSLCIEFW
jgi:hypothetical protein